MQLELPSGSTMSVTTDGADTLILVPHAGGRAKRYFMGLCLLAWLGGWAFGWISAATALVAASQRGGVSAFLGFWLAAWTLAGVMAIYSVYRLLRPSVPESLRLAANGVLYDSGFAPPQLHYGYHASERRHGDRCFQEGPAWSWTGGRSRHCG